MDVPVKASSQPSHWLRHRVWHRPKQAICTTVGLRVWCVWTRAGPEQLGTSAPN